MTIEAVPKSTRSTAAIAPPISNSLRISNSLSSWPISHLGPVGPTVLPTGRSAIGTTPESCCGKPAGCGSGDARRAREQHGDLLALVRERPPLLAHVEV